MNSKVLKVLVCSLFAIPPYAIAQNWYYVGDAQNGKLVRLVDKDSIRKSGSTVKAWTLTLLREYEPRLKNANSLKQQWEFDCKNETKTMIFQTAFRDGDVVFSDNSSAKVAEPVIPGSLDFMGFEFACGKKTKAIDIGDLTEMQMRDAFWSANK